MKRILIAGLILSTFTVAGQELKKVTKNKLVKSYTSIREEYFVLKDSKNIKHGPYKKWVNKKLAEEGYYKNNMKDSTWIIYGLGQTIQSTGNYTNNEKAGIWEYYINTIELEQEYDFTKKALVSFKPDKKVKIHQIITKRDTIYAPLDRPPLIIGGSYAYLEQVAKHIRYPVSAMRNNITGTVFISFMLDEAGKTSDFKVVKKGNKDLDTEALRVVKLIDNWLPAMKDGKPVKVIHIVPIIFENSDMIKN